MGRCVRSGLRYENGDGLRSRILVVDDSSAVRRGFARAINEQSDFRVCGEAANGQECLAKVLELRPDAVILDISMPIMNGLDAARLLRELMPSLPVIICSYFDGPSLEQEAQTVGAKGIVSRAQPIEQLLACLRSVIGGSL